MNGNQFFVTAYEAKLTPFALHLSQQGFEIERDNVRCLSCQAQAVIVSTAAGEALCRCVEGCEMALTPFALDMYRKGFEVERDGVECPADNCKAPAVIVTTASGDPMYICVDGCYLLASREHQAPDPHCKLCGGAGGYGSGEACDCWLPTVLCANFLRDSGRDALSVACMRDAFAEVWEV